LALIGEVLAALSLLIVSIVSFLTLRRTSRIENMIPSLDDIVRVNEDGSIDMDTRLQAIITGVGQTMMQSFKMSTLQGLSVNSKLEKGLKGAFAKDIIDNKLPIANLLGDIVGVNVKQYVAKNPDALMQLLGMPQVQGLLGKLSGNNGARAPNQSSW